MSGANSQFIKFPNATCAKRQTLFDKKTHYVEPNAIRELLFYRAVEHPNIMRAQKYSFRCNRLTIKMPRATSLDTWIRTAPYQKRERHAEGVLRDMARALEFLHGNGIAHGDVKPQNFVIDSMGHVELIDFGTVQVRHARRGYQRGMTTYWFVAPEDAGHDVYGPAADIWALGLTMIYYWNKIYALRHASHEHARAWFSKNSTVPVEFLSPLMHELVTRMLDFDPARRITASEILSRLGATPLAGRCELAHRDDNLMVDHLLARAGVAEDTVSYGCAYAISQAIFEPWFEINIAEIAQKLGAPRRRVYEIFRRVIINLA